MKHILACLLLCTLAAPSLFAASTSVPVDAFGRKLDAPTLLMDHFDFPNISPAWRHTFQLLLSREKEIWGKALGMIDAEAQCSWDYRKENPKASAHDFDAFMQTPPAADLLGRCGNRILNDPHLGPKLIEAHMAFETLKLIKNDILRDLREQEKIDFMNDQPPQGFVDTFQDYMPGALKYYTCLVAEADKQITNRTDFHHRMDALWFYAMERSQKGACAQFQSGG